MAVRPVDARDKPRDKPGMTAKAADFTRHV
jgi:hypothetical protein